MNTIVTRLTIAAALAVGANSGAASRLPHAFHRACVAVALTKSGDLIRRQPPYAAGTSTIRAVWHGRDEHDVGHAWMRELVAQTARIAEKARG
jgi:hypothetical protein